MKIVLLSALLSILVLGAVAELTDNDYQYLFYKYVSTHSKTYQDVAEHQRRFAIFKQNYARVQQHNEEAAAGIHSFTLGMNQFADMTNEEYRMKMLGLRRARQPGPSVETPSRSAVTMVRDLPPSLDWRQKGVVTDPKDQGQCGSCWAFSAVGAMEGAHALKTGKLVSFSEQELVDCVNGGADDCNTGGEMHDGYLYAIQAGGMETEADYPYEGTSGHQCRFDKTKVAATFSSYKNVTSGDEGALTAAIVEQPTISVGIDASSFFFQLYSSGVYDDPSCKNKWNELDHGVLVVGYGTDSGKDYWLVKNSWGAWWGKQGYILMSRNKNNQCGIATDATYPL